MASLSCPWWKSPTGVLVLLALAALGLYLIVVHQQHVLGALPFLLILLCPLSHRFMHHHHSHTDGEQEKESENHSGHHP